MNIVDTVDKWIMYIDSVIKRILYLEGWMLWAGDLRGPNKRKITIQTWFYKCPVILTVLKRIEILRQK
jgi:hypothetical protein